MELTLDIPSYQKEPFLEYVDEFVDEDSPLEVKYATLNKSGGLNITIPEVITIVSSTVAAIELARLLVSWLKSTTEDKIVIKNKAIDAEITIKKGISEEDAIKLIRDLSDINDK